MCELALGANKMECFGLFESLFPIIYIITIRKGTDFVCAEATNEARKKESTIFVFLSVSLSLSLYVRKGLMTGTGNDEPAEATATARN